MNNMKNMEKLQNWVEERYEILWDAFGNTSFSREDAIKKLKEKSTGDIEDRKDLEGIAVLFSELKKVGLLTIKQDPYDKRRSLYTLKSKDELIRETLSIENNKLTRADIEVILKKAADLIRTRVDYKFILILLFLKRISDKWDQEYKIEYEKALRDGLTEEEAKREARNPAYHDFDLPQEYFWENIRKDVSQLPERFSEALKEISNRNPELKDVLDNVDFIQFTSNRENSEILRQLVELFSAQKFHDVSADVLGDAYEWILRYFAPQKAKEGEVYTPREVIRLLVEVLKPKPGESVYDPACGSGGMLIVSYEYIKKKYEENNARKLFLYGQEANPKTLAFGRMNLYIHDIRNVQLAQGDTLLYPKFKEGEGVKKFDVVIANPPWNQDGYSEDVIKKGEFWKQRFKYGFVSKQSADWAWIQHMWASAKDDNGRVGVVIDNGCLFRGGKEEVIRKTFLEKDFIEAVILLPEKLFYNTGAPGAIIILNKNKSEERKEKVLFINENTLMLGN